MAHIWNNLLNFFLVNLSYSSTSSNAVGGDTKISTYQVQINEQYRLKRDPEMMEFS